MTLDSSTRRSVIVTGAGGQDGFYLVSRLLAEGSVVHATVRSRSGDSEIEDLPGADQLTIHELDVTDALATRALISTVRPTELFNLAGHSSVFESFGDPSRTWQANAGAVQGLLEAIRTESPSTTFYQSSSTDMFGSYAGLEVIHDEQAAFRPESPYAAAKAAAHMLCDAYRRAFGLRIACGILSNHESRRRPTKFLTRKIVDHVRLLREALSTGGEPGQPLRVGNLAARRDWGFAPDYVDGMVRICRQIAVRAEVSGRDPEANIGSSYRDYVLASGQLHAVWELIDRTFDLAGLPLVWDRTSTDPAGWSASLKIAGSPAVVVDPALIRPSDPAAIGANPAKAQAELRWKARPGLDPFLVDMLRIEDSALTPSGTR